VRSLPVSPAARNSVFTNIVSDIIASTTIHQARSYDANTVGDIIASTTTRRTRILRNQHQIATKYKHNMAPSSSASPNDETIKVTISEHDLKMIAKTLNKNVINCTRLLCSPNRLASVFPSIANANRIADSPAVRAAPEANDDHFNIISRARAHANFAGYDCSVKVKGSFCEAATERLANSTAAANERLASATAASTERLATTAIVSTGIMATPFVLGALGGLAIWKMTGRRAPSVAKAVCCPFLFFSFPFQSSRTRLTGTGDERQAAENPVRDAHQDEACVGES
jgi:hypothetical protein